MLSLWDLYNSIVNGLMEYSTVASRTSLNLLKDGHNPSERMLNIQRQKGIALRKPSLGFVSFFSLIFSLK